MEAINSFDNSSISSVNKGLAILKELVPTIDLSLFDGWDYSEDEHYDILTGRNCIIKINKHFAYLNGSLELDYFGKRISLSLYEDYFKNGLDYQAYSYDRFVIGKITEIDFEAGIPDEKILKVLNIHRFGLNLGYRGDANLVLNPTGKLDVLDVNFKSKMVGLITCSETLRKFALC